LGELHSSTLSEASIPSCNMTMILAHDSLATNACAAICKLNCWTDYSAMEMWGSLELRTHIKQLEGPTSLKRIRNFPRIDFIYIQGLG